jgi:hypothetical protein
VKKHDVHVDLDTPSELPTTPYVPISTARTLWQSSEPTPQPQPASSIPITTTTLSDNERGPVYQKYKALFFFKLERELEKVHISIIN